MKLEYINSIIAGLNNNPKTVEDLVSNIIEGVKSSKLNNLNSNTLFNILSNSWYGQNAKEALIIL